MASLERRPWIVCTLGRCRLRRTRPQPLIPLRPRGATNRLGTTHAFESSSFHFSPSTFAWELGFFFASVPASPSAHAGSKARAGLSGVALGSVKLSAKCRNPDEVAMHRRFISYSIRIISQIVEGAGFIRLLKRHFR